MQLNGNRATFEDVMAQMTAALIHSTEGNLNNSLNAWLERLAHELEADYAEVVEVPTATGLTPQSALHATWPAAKHDPDANRGATWLRIKLATGEPFAISDLGELPPAAAADRERLEQIDVRSIVWVPMIAANDTVGWFAIGNALSGFDWSDLALRRCRFVADIVCSAIVAARAQSRDRPRNGGPADDCRLAAKRFASTQACREIVGDSSALRAALSKVEQVAPTDSTVLILGETGTGKELLAQAIHDCSARRQKRMIKINCAALPSSLVEAELFGREKGAYTGSLSREAGRFELAHGSTLLLDEIGELSLEVQAKLLRVLQDGEFERLGSSKTLHTDVRVLAATNRDLRRAVEEKKFREDLYYRLAVFPIDVPPLRDRNGDLAKLIWAFVLEFSEKMGKNIESISPADMTALQAYSWPGNVRELRNVIERAMIVSQGPELDVEVPTATVATPESSQVLADVERQHIRQIVESRAWRIRGVNGAAEVLGLKPTTLEARMKKLGIVRETV